MRSICRALMLCFGAAGGVPALAASQETDIDVVVLRAFSALSEGDVDAYLSQVRPGARVIVHYSGTLELHVDEWRASLRDVTWEPRQISSRVFGNTAVTVAQLDGTLRMPGGDAFDGPWRFAETRIRDQGTWRIVQLELSALDPAADAVVEIGARRPAADAGETGRIAGVTSGRAAAPARQITDPPAPVGGAMINQAGQDGATLRAVRVNEPLEIDGVIEEPFYQSVPPITEFVQVVPEEDGEPSEFTEVWIGFDDDNVYVSAKIWYAAGSDGWIANEMRRDSRRLASNDHFGVWFDTFYDRRNAVGFYGNAIGGIIDMQITNEGSPNFDWNPLRETRTARFDGGWSIEMAIPFKSLRYRPGREQVWGIQMRRFIGRRNEWEYIRAVPFSVASDGWQGIFRVSMYGTLMGIEAPPPSRNLEVKPYVISGLDTNLLATPQIDRDGYADAGLDIKYGITENLTADLTFNTDFAQVEVDEQQVKPDPLLPLLPREARVLPGGSRHLQLRLGRHRRRGWRLRRRRRADAVLQPPDRSRGRPGGADPRGRPRNWKGGLLRLGGSSTSRRTTPVRSTSARSAATGRSRPSPPTFRCSVSAATSSRGAASGYCSRTATRRWLPPGRIRRGAWTAPSDCPTS